MLPLVRSSLKRDTFQGQYAVFGTPRYYYHCPSVTLSVSVFL